MHGSRSINLPCRSHKNAIKQRLLCVAFVCISFHVTIAAGTDALTDMKEKLACVVVRVDIFSGRSNPTWILSKQNASELLSKIHNIPSSERAIPPAGLGYNGFILRGFDEATRIQEIRVSNRQVIVQKTGNPALVLEDVNRAIERWLWQIAKGHVPEEVRELAHQAMEQQD